MKQLIVLALYLIQIQGLSAQKQLYIPNEWKNPWPADSLLYKESDPDNKYTWSKSRSKESENCIVYWDKGYGKTIPTNAPSGYKVDIDDLLAKCEEFYKLNVGTLAFCDEATSKVKKYKMMILMNHTTNWTCYGSGYDNMVPALWLNPSTCQPVGHSVAHEVGHSFQYMCYSDLGGNAGFRTSIGDGSVFWEQTAQWQANQSYPDQIWNQSWSVFKNTANYAMTHELMRYQSYWWHYYLTEKYDIDFIGKLWRHNPTKAGDPNETFMDLMGYDNERFFKEYFEYAMKMATIDLDIAHEDSDLYIGSYTFNYVPLGGTKYQVAYSSCPQSTGFNVIQLSVPKAGTEVSVDFTSLKKTATIADGDPVEYYYGGQDPIVHIDNKKYYNCYSNSKYKNDRAFRLGYVALLADGTRKYIYEDKLYCYTGKDGNVTENVSAIVPENTERLFFVVVPAPLTYYQHKWDEDVTNDDQWPYQVELHGTNITEVPIISDDLPISDATITYDVYFAKTTGSDYSGTNVTISGEAVATLGTAFQMQASDINTKLKGWTSAGPKAGEIMFYATGTNGKITNGGSTANGYGHWFNASGTKTAYSSGYLYSEFSPSTLTFTVGQYPNKLTTGKDYTIRQAFVYNNGTKKAQVTFVFNVHITTSKNGAKLKSIEQSEIVTGIAPASSTSQHFSNSTSQYLNKKIHTLDGREVRNMEWGGIYIVNGKKIKK